MSSQFRTRIFKVRETADILRTTPWKVTALCRSGELRASRIGTNWRITEAAIEEYLKATEPEPEVQQAADGTTPQAPPAPRRRRRRPASS